MYTFVILRFSCISWNSYLPTFYLFIYLLICMLNYLFIHLVIYLPPYCLMYLLGYLFIGLCQETRHQEQEKGGVKKKKGLHSY